MCTISRNKFKRYYLKNKRLRKKMSIRLIISEIMDCERSGYLNN